MKIEITLRDPDGFSEGIYFAAQDSVDELGLIDEERAILIENRISKIGEFLERWVSYGETITLEFDTDNKTVKVLTRDE